MQELGADFNMGFAAAWGYCAAMGGLSVLLAGRVFGRTFNDLPDPKKVLWHVYAYCLCTGCISCGLLAGSFREIFYEHLWDADFLMNGRPVPGFRTAVGFSVGFLTFDLAVMLVWHKTLLIAYKKPMYIQMLVHHGLSIFFWPQTLQRRCALGYVSWCILTEASSVFVNLHWLLREAKLDGGALGIINSVCLFFSYLIVRILPIPWLAWMWWTSPKREWLWLEYILGGLGAALPPLLNLYWFSFIVRGAASKLFPGKFEKRSKGNQETKKE